MNYMEVETASVSNGLGFRVVLWVSGCSLQCPHCQNPETWDLSAGKPFTEEIKTRMFEELQKEWVKGITLSGGHPLDPENCKEVLKLIEEIRNQMPEKDIWLYTGLTLNADDFFRDDILSKTIQNCDFIVDGPYIHQLRDVTLAFRGSSNQRIINVKETIKQKEIKVCDLDSNRRR